MGEPANKTSVICVEDEQLIALDLQCSIDEQPDMHCLATFQEAGILLKEVEQKRPHIVLLDLTMPGEDPLDVLSELSKKFPDTRAIVFSGYHDQSLIDKALDAGAWGYVVKNGDLNQVIEAIRQVAKGEFALPVL